MNPRKIPQAVRKRDGTLVPFDLQKIEEAIFKAAESVGGHDREKTKEVALEVQDRLRGNGVPSVDEINDLCCKTLSEMGYDGTAVSYHTYSRRRAEVRERLKVLGAQQGSGPTDGFLMVASQTDEVSFPWNREKITESLLKETNLDLRTAGSVAKSLENTILLSKLPAVTTSLIRELAHTEMIKRGFNDAAGMYQSFGISLHDLEVVIFRKGNENSNIVANNPEAVAFNLSGRTSKSYALSQVFSKEVADAHTTGMIHLHDLDLITRVYCSGHSLEYLKKFGLALDNLQTGSSPSKHARTLTGHLNTFFASMQAYYAGALGVGFTNIFYAPHVSADLEGEARPRIDSAERDHKKLIWKIEDGRKAGKDVSLLEEAVKEKEQELGVYRRDPLSALTDEEIDKFIKQEAQQLIFVHSQNAFSRGGQTLFLDFNVHSGVPEYMKNTLAVEPSGKYAIRKKGRKVFLDERKLREKTDSGYNLIELVDPETGRVVMKERLEEKPMGKAKVKELVQDWVLEEGEKPVTYGDYDKLSKRIARRFLDVWREGDEMGQPFAFPKCDLHVSKEAFNDGEQVELLKYACQIASENGSPYFVFDRDAVTLAACCRLKTTITDNYTIKHPESMRFCGFQNVTINLPQAAYRAARKGKKNLEGFLEEVDNALGIVVKAHLQKKEFIEQLQKPGLPQWQTGKPSLDSQPYIDLDKATYIVGHIGLNEAVQFITGKELHELDNKEFEEFALKPIAHLNVAAKKYGEEHGLKFSLEETPAESASRRLSKIDLSRFEEARNYVRGDIENDQTYYTNSIHDRADAPVSIIERIQRQSMFHPAIESGAIIHAFIGEEKPSAESIFNLVKKTFETTQAAQLTISPEFTACLACKKTNRGLVEKCLECGNDDKRKLKGMTRIVGYYSYVDNWNPSKMAELEARHQGNYSLVSVGDFYQGRVPRLETPNGKPTAYLFGKHGCNLCDNAKKIVEKSAERLYEKLGVKVDVAELKVDTGEGLAKAMLAKVNLSELPYLVVVDSASNEALRVSTEYNGETRIIHTGRVYPELEKHFSKPAKK